MGFDEESSLLDAAFDEENLYLSRPEPVPPASLSSSPHKQSPANKNIATKPTIYFFMFLLL